MAYHRLRKYAEAVKDLDRAVELSPKAEQPPYRAARAQSRLNAGQVAEAVAEVAELTKTSGADAPGSPKWNAGQRYNFACVYSVASGKIADKQQAYTDRAMVWLTKAVAAGFADFTLLDEDGDLDALRDRADFRKLLADIPPVVMAHSYILRSQWNKAAAAYAKADPLARPLRDDAFAYAALFLIRGDSEGYNRFCQDMIQRAAQTKDHFEAFVLARTCAMARQSPVDPARIVQWANQAVASDQPGRYFHALGLAQYRAGQFDGALQSFTKADVKEWAYRDLNWLALALVHHRLGHPDEARQVWTRASSGWSGKLRRAPGGRQTSTPSIG
jgi:tetratricopeptide (TPR) repeat protein